jgi:hypothetical protein
MSFKLKMNSYRNIARGVGKRNGLPQKDNILLQRGLRLESSFDTSLRCGKTTAASKASLPRFCRLRAATPPDEVATSPNPDRDHSDQSATM